MRAKRIVATVLAVAVGGCGVPFYVVSEPRAAEIYVDGKFVGVGRAVVDTNGIVFNSYRVEARDENGHVLDATDVDIHFGPRSAVLAGVGLLGVILWPLLPLLPAAFFVGEPNPEHVYLHAPPPAEAAPGPQDTLDRPVLEITTPGNGDEVPARLTMKGRARHWSGVASVRLELDGTTVTEIRPNEPEVEVRFETVVAIDTAGHHVLRVVAAGVRGAEAAEERRVTRVVPGLEGK